MNVHRINYLMQQIFCNRDVLCFDELYIYADKFTKDSMKDIYKAIKNKTLYSESDVLQEAWINIWILINKEHVVVKSLDEFNYFILGIITDTIIQINKELVF